MELQIVPHIERITLRKLLDNRNIDGEIYDVDVSRWLGVWLDHDRTQEIKQQLKEVIQYVKV